jgi:sulfite reductase alpha subunit-like flavoprotein
VKSLKHFILESVRTYAYTIKIAGKVDKNFLDMFCFNLKKFDPVEISEPKSTPIQKDPYGFPDLENESVTIIKCVFRYPATEPMIQQIAQLLGYQVNLVRVVKTSYDDSINDEMENYSNQMRHSPVLTHEELEEEKTAKAASKAYGDSYLQSIKDQAKDDKIQYVYDAKKTPDAFDPFKPYLDNDPRGINSPMSHITRPAKPQTGAHKG